ncbi:MAG TPA: LysE family translocator [Acidothermaceae bacterium]
MRNSADEPHVSRHQFGHRGFARDRCSAHRVGRSWPRRARERGHGAGLHPGDRSPLVLDGLAARESHRRVIGSAILANLLNPKLTIFFFAFLPQFVPEHSSAQLMRMLGLNAVFMAMTFIVFVGYGVFAAGVRRHLIERPRIVRRVRQAFAVSFVALGAKLAVTAR